MKKLVILLLLPVFILSCAQVENAINKDPKQYIPKTEKYGNFAFIIPANFELKEDASIIYKQGKNVRAYLVYEGHGSIEKIANFLDQSLQKLGWNKSSELIGNSAAILVYKRDNQMIIYKIERLITGTFIKVLLTCA